MITIKQFIPLIDNYLCVLTNNTASDCSFNYNTEMFSEHKYFMYMYVYQAQTLSARLVLLDRVTNNLTKLHACTCIRHAKCCTDYSYIHV